MSRPFNLWILNHYGGNEAVGMEYRHSFIGRHLQHRGHRVSIIAASEHHLRARAPAFEGRLGFDRYEGVDHAWIRTPAYQGNGVGRLVNMLSYSARVRRFRSALVERLGRPDAVLASSPHPFVVLNLMALARRFDAAALFEVRDLWPQMLIELGAISRHHPLSMLFAALEGIGYRRADRVLSLWHSADDYMMQHGLTPDRYVYLPNGVDVASSEPASDAADHPLLAAVRRERAQGRFLVGYGGSHGYANPLDCVVDACARLRDQGRSDVAFFMVGDGPDKARMLARAAELGLPNLHFHDYVSRDVALRFFREMDALFMGLRDLPLFRYGPTPNKLMDYLIAGRPIIYAIDSSFDPVAEAGAGVTIPPDDPAALVGAIETLRALPADERERRGQAGRSWALEHLEYARIAEKLEQVVYDCIDPA